VTDKILRTDQIADLAYHIANKRSMNLNDPGTGKTGTVVVNQFRRQQEGIKTLWIQPKSLMRKNVEEIMAFTGLPRSAIGVMDGTPAQIQKEILKGPAIYLCGPDFLKKVTGLVAEWGISAVDVDEFHMCFGGPNSARTNAFYEIQPLIRESIYMTGTLINGRLDTSFAAIDTIDRGFYPLGYDQFLYEHAITDVRGKILGWDNHDRIREILGRHAIRRTFESIFGKQKVVFDTDWVEMAPAQRNMFDKFKAEAFLELDLFMLDGSLPGPATLRARQIMEHPNVFPDLTDPKGKRRINIMPGEAPGKEQSLEIHFDEHYRRKTPLILFAFFKDQQERIVELATRCGLRARYMNGDTPMNERSEIDEAYKRGDLDLNVLSPAIGATGWNWQFSGDRETCHVINTSLSYMDSDFSQGFKRAIRGKRTSPLRVTTQAYYDSLDRRQMDILIHKSMDAHKVDPSRDIIQFNSH